MPIGLGTWWTRGTSIIRDEDNLSLKAHKARDTAATDDLVSFFAVNFYLTTSRNATCAVSKG